MNAVAQALTSVAAVLAQAGHQWALVGGLAVSCHVDPRFTRDIDIAIAVADDDDAEALVRTLSAGDYRVVTAIEQDAVGRLATVRLVGTSVVSDVLLDLLFASSGIEREICADAIDLEALPGLTVPVACRAHLIAMKLLSVDEQRLQDAIDLGALLATATTDDVSAIETALRLIEARGFARGRDLPAMLQMYLARRSVT